MFGKIKEIVENVKFLRQQPADVNPFAAFSTDEFSSFNVEGHAMGFVKQAAAKRRQKNGYQWRTLRTVEEAQEARAYHKKIQEKNKN